jgi:N4-(beta-N-acetylglucosaminyl)-L-asparaginase
MHTRRKFLELSGLGLLAASLANKNTSIVNSPIVIATWDSGIPVAKEAFTILNQKGTALDAVTAGAVYSENQPSCCVGLGAYPDRDGIVTLDASIMDYNQNAGSVAGMEQIKNPILVARKVMETTPHVMLVGQGAQQFAIQSGFALQSKELSKDAKNAYTEWLKKNEYKPEINIEAKKQNGPFAPNYFDDGTPNHDTMGLVALDALGNLGGACTTSGMAFKVHGRVGDSPIIGAGLYVDNAIGAVTSSGVGEEVIKICGSHLVTEYMRQGYSPTKACKKAVERIVQRDAIKAKAIQVGFCAINKKGQHGGYALQKGFMYAVHSNKEIALIKTESYFS